MTHASHIHPKRRENSFFFLPLERGRERRRRKRERRGRERRQQSLFPSLSISSHYLSLSLWSTATTTCRDGWLGFLFRWRTQQSAISGINCRIIQLPNLWTQKAHGRSFSRVIPVHAAHPQCRTTKTPKKKEGRKKEMGGEIPSISLSLSRFVRGLWKPSAGWKKKKAVAGEREGFFLSISLFFSSFFYDSRRCLLAEKKKTREGGVFLLLLLLFFSRPRYQTRKKTTKNSDVFYPFFFPDFVHRPECGRTTR